MIAAGGTGGHIFPAQAFIETLRKMTNYRLVLLGDKRILPLSGALKKIEFHRISAEGISGRSRLGFLLAITILAIGFLQSLYLLRKTRPAVVIGFGGYAALPPMLAANITRVPTVLHEQNAVLGRANRLLLPGADRVALSFRQTRFIEGSISKGLAVWTGNPVRSSFQRLTQKSYQTINSKNDTIRLLVLGGSQGARVFGSCVPQAIALLPQNLRERIQLCQQVRKDQIQSVRQFYKRYRIKAQTNHFFADIAARMDAAHLIVCRAGATTLAEIVTVGRPAVLIPYPHAIDDHQRTLALTRIGAEGIDDSAIYDGWVESAVFEHCCNYRCCRCFSMSSCDGDGCFEAHQFC